MFWQQNKKVTFNPGSLKLDMHNHLLPGVDDGVDSVGESIELLTKMQDCGFETVIITPHIYRDFFPNEKEELQGVYDALKEQINKELPDLDTGLGAEYHYDDYFEYLVEQEQGLLSFLDDYLLIEFPVLQAPDRWKDTLFTLETRGYRPVLAHVERYPYFDQSDWEELRRRGILIQVNLLSLSERYGRNYQERALNLLDGGWIDLLATDIHRLSQWSMFEDLRLPASVVRQLEEAGRLNQKWNEENS